MKNFLSIDDVKDVQGLISSAQSFKASPFQKDFYRRKTIGLLFFNPSLRTRLSTVKAAKNLGLEVIVMNVTADSWKLETEEGVVMDTDKAEHIQDAAAVIGEYCDVLGIRSFPTLKDRDEDYEEKVLKAFVAFSGKPVVNLESATLHPLQSLADVMTIEETKTIHRPKVVLTWAPHVKPLPQSVANSFAQWMNAMDYNFKIACPEGMELANEFIQDAEVINDQDKVLEGADFIYAKNWSSYKNYGQLVSHRNWMIDEDKMRLTNNGQFMHCLPVRRNLVVTDSVLDGSNSIHIQQAGNRVWSAQAVLSEILKDETQ